ncbi:MAG: isoprenyl transferase [bacterium]|nr:isoprenyl transferase [bacterium]
MTSIADKTKQEILGSGGKVPEHIAIIMDGNGRWAAQRDKPRTFGHEAGVGAVKEVVKAATEIGVKYLTLYTFSVENWKRPKSEVAALMSLLSRTTRRELDELMANDVKLITVGRISKLSPTRRRILNRAVEQTKNNRGLQLILALNYSGRMEILDAVRGMVNAAKAGYLDPNEINEEQFSDFLYTADLPDPDLLIRTSGEMRLSNFLLWQTSYTELYVVDTLWPDFGRQELFEAIKQYLTRERRFGELSKKRS